MTVARLGFAFVAAVLCPFAGCRTPESPHVAPTRAERLRDAYPALRAGPFALIADFEDPSHMELFHASAETPVGAVRLDGQNGRPETGAACLEFTAGSSFDAVVADNNKAERWYLKRDWRDFHLLFMSVNAPVEGLSFHIAITSGRSADAVTAETSLTLEQGWNPLRLDLGELGEQIALDEIRSVRFSVSGMRQPVTIRIDDILLVASQEALFGDASNSEGELYVERIGRRWRVGAGGRFELVFSSGQVSGWYNLAADPYRLRNLVRGTTLGPVPVLAAASGDTGRSAFPSATRVVSRQAVLEMNAVRVVIATQWQFVTDPEAGPDDRPSFRWVYTIYPTGQLFVSVDANFADETDPDAPLAIALSLTTRDVTGWHTRSVGANRAERNAMTAELPSYATARSEAGSAFVLFVPWPGATVTDMQEERDAKAPALSLIASGDGAPHTGQRHWDCHIWLAATADVDEREALQRAQAYAQPPSPRVRIGVVESRPAKAEGAAGFDPSTGVFALEPEGNRLVAGLPGAPPVFSPCFSVTRQGDPRSWVYVNHVILEPVAVGRAEDLVFQVPGVVREPVVVEVLLREFQAAGRP